MIITFKKIAKMVNCENAPINYYKYENDCMRYVTYFESINSEHSKEYEKMSENEKKEYISNSAAIFLPLISPDHYKEETKKVMSPDYSWTLKKVETKIHILPEYESMSVALYMILHEIGHWYDFLRCEKKPYFYMPQEEIQKEKELHDYRKNLQQTLSLKKELSPHDRGLIKKYIYDYNNLPREKRANIYADEHYIESYNKLCEEWNIK